MRSPDPPPMPSDGQRSSPGGSAVVYNSKTNKEGAEESRQVWRWRPWTAGERGCPAWGHPQTTRPKGVRKGNVSCCVAHKKTFEGGD
eukprot:87164-Prorocentrum_minimum.AAC.1